MGLIHIMERGGEGYREYKKALKTAKRSIETLCELTDDMEDEYGFSKRDSRHEEDDDRYVVMKRMR